MKKLTLILALAFTMGLGASAVTQDKKEAKKATTTSCTKTEKKACCATAAGKDTKACTEKKTEAEKSK